MLDNTSILLVGLGSIGKRHLRNILSLGYTAISVVSTSGSLPEEFSGLPVHASLDKALSHQKFDAAVICTPTALHMATLIPLLDAGIKNIYVEKPVSHNYKGIDELINKSKEYGTRIIVGFDLHYDCGLQKVKELIASNAIGTIVSANAQVGQYLPDWRPHEDYRLGMSARKETGGGVMLDLVHEFDYLYWLLGNVETVASFSNNSGSLEIETEDVAEVLLKFSNGAIGTIHLDYLQPKLVRNCMLTGSNGSIFWNLADSKVKWIDGQKQEQEFSYMGFERNDRFIHIIKDFLEKNDNAFTTSLQQGLQSLRMVLAAKHSSDKGVFVNLNQFNH